MKRLILTVWLCLLAMAASAQIPVPYIFVPNTPASATQVNANFDVLARNALNLAGGTIKGNITIDPGVTIDGIDISAVFGGTGSKILTVDGAKLISKVAPQLTLGFDATHLMTVAIDLNGNAVFDTLTPGSGFTFNDPATFGTLTTTNFTCSGCIGAAQIADNTVGSAEITNESIASIDIADGTVSGLDIANGTIGSIDIGDASIASIDIADGSIGAADLDNILGGSAGAYGNSTTIGTFTVDADGRITAASNVAITFPAPPAVSYGDITSTNYDFQLTSATLQPGSEFARIILKASYDGSLNTTTGDPAIRFVIGTSIATYGPVEIHPWGISATGAVVSQNLSVGARLFVPNGTPTDPTVTFTGLPGSGMYYNDQALPNGQSVDFGSNFSSNTNRSLLRARTTEPKVDIMTGTSIPMSFTPGIVTLGAHMLPSSSNNLLLGNGSFYWNTVWVGPLGISQGSDMRTKNNLGPIGKALEAIDRLSPFLATSKLNGTPRDFKFPTFSAQEVSERLDSIYGTSVATHDAKNDAWGIDYGKLTPILWQGTKELHAKVKILEAKVEAQTLALAALEIRLAKHKH